jgi:hypothetical protein
MLGRPREVRVGRIEGEVGSRPVDGHRRQRAAALASHRSRAMVGAERAVIEGLSCCVSGAAIGGGTIDAVRRSLDQLQLSARADFDPVGGRCSGRGACRHQGRHERMLQQRENRDERNLPAQATHSNHAYEYSRRLQRLAMGGAPSGRWGRVLPFKNSLLPGWTRVAGPHLTKGLLRRVLLCRRRTRFGIGPDAYFCSLASSIRTLYE